MALASVVALLLAACSGGDDSGATFAGGAGGEDGASGSSVEGGSTPDGGSAADGSRDAGPVDWTVNGHVLSAREQAAMMVIAGDVVPRLEGSRDDRLTLSARGAWWALKEGTWEQSLPAIYGYSNCNSASGDSTIGPTEVCEPGRAWQVGLAAVQVPGHGVAELEALAPKLFPGMATAALLADVVAKAGEAKAVSDEIVASTGSLRASWLLRVPALGMAVVVPGEIVPECIDGAKSWCFGSVWDETKKFAPTKGAALVSIADLRRILASLSP
ncbi:MAG: hypothetical protein JWP87_4678 [Labilithrix sp.]|nr:hypothetical protein [Labilithrix sp.]